MRSLKNCAKWSYMLFFTENRKKPAVGNIKLTTD